MTSQLKKVNVSNKDMQSGVKSKSSSASATTLQKGLYDVMKQLEVLATQCKEETEQRPPSKVLGASTTGNQVSTVTEPTVLSNHDPVQVDQTVHAIIGGGTTSSNDDGTPMKRFARALLVFQDCYNSLDSSTFDGWRGC